MDIQEVKVERLHMAEYNPRQDLKPGDKEYEKLKRSIQEFGYVEPIVWNRATGNVVGGHQRLKVLKDMGFSRINCVVVDMDLQREKALNLALNKVNGAWDEQLLANLIGELNDGIFDVTLTGFDAAEIEDLLQGTDPDSADEDDYSAVKDDAEADEGAPVSRYGDIWLLGRHRLMCGNSTDRADVERLMDGKRANLVFTDPPYGVEYTGGVGKTWDMIKADNKQGDDLYSNLLIPAFKNLYEFAADDAAFYIWHASSTRREFEDAMTAVGLIERQYLVWVKNNFQMGHADYHWGHEPCFYANKAGQSVRFFGDRTNQTVWRIAARTPDGFETTVTGGVVVTDGAGDQIFIAEKAPKGKKIRSVRLKNGANLRLYSDDATGSAWEISKETGFEHPTQKPVLLAVRAINNSSMIGEIVLDLFGGSGSTMIAAEQTQRKGYTMEIDPRYCDVIVNRYIAATNTDRDVFLRRDGQEMPHADAIQSASELAAG